jgi:nucleoside-diphosphate-sugar epimerase
MKVLFIGGTGNISWYCATKAQQAGHEVWILNKGEVEKTRRQLPAHAKQLYADIRDIEAIKNALKGMKFDVVADFLCYTPEQAQADIKLFRGITKQFIFVSSAGNYQRPCEYPIAESNRLYNPKWEYSQNKIDCEKIFLKYYKKEKFPVTIVRPGHTYDTLLPDAVGKGDWTNAKRMIEGKPIVIHGDGSTLWTLTHSEDFARAFVKLFGKSSAIGQAFHITSDELLNWRQISEMVASALGVKNPRFIYVPSETIAKLNPEIGEGLIFHKTWCDIYDNSKIKSIAKGWKAEISFEKGIKRTIAWLKADKNRQRVNLDLDLFLDDLCKRFDIL